MFSDRLFFFSNCRQHVTLISFCSRVSRPGTQRAHTFLMFSLLCKILVTVLLLSLTAVEMSSIVIFRSWPMIFITFSAFSSVHSEDGLPHLGISATFERPHLNYLHLFFTEAYEGQDF